MKFFTKHLYVSIIGNNRYIYRSGIIYRCNILLVEKVPCFVKNKFSYERERDPHYWRCFYDTNPRCPPTDNASGLIILGDRYDILLIF
jgi:hypothetical protein